MNTIKLLATSVAFASAFSFAALLNAYPMSGKASDTYSTHLSEIDSASFKKSNGIQQVYLKKNKKTVKSFNLEDLAALSFAVRDSSKELLMIHVKSSQSRVDTIMLKKVQAIEFYEMDDQKDEDGDLISDFEERFFYETNPKDVDTDGDGWTDNDEIVKYSPTNPLLWNPKIADLPKLSVELMRTPEILLNVTLNENQTETKTLTKGESRLTSQSRTRSSTITSQVQTTLSSKVNFSTSNEFSATPKASVAFGVELSASNSMTSATGTTWSDADTKSLTETFNKAEAEAESQGKTISGSSVFMQLKLKNTGNIAYSISNLNVAASIATPDGENIIISELSHCGNVDNDKIGILAARDSLSTMFCNRKVPRKFTESLITNPGTLFADAIEKTLTYTWPTSHIAYDFTHAYTNVSAKTAHISIDYGPRKNKADEFKEFLVSTKYRINGAPTSLDDLYEKISLAQAFKIAKIQYVEETMCKDDVSLENCKETIFGLKSIDEISYNAKNNAYWIIAIKKANKSNEILYYSPFLNHISLDSIFISAGDDVMLSYSEDKDGDNVPFRVEMLYGSSDEKKDTDGDGLDDDDEIYGWENASLPGFEKVRTSPIKKDTDDDGIDDGEDEDPLHRPLSTNNRIETISFINGSSKNAAFVDRENDICYHVSSIYDSTVNIKIVTETPVKNVKIRYMKNDYRITSTGKEFNISLPTSTSEKYMDIVITPETGEEKSYTVNLNYGLQSPEDLKLYVNAEKNALRLNFTPPTGEKGSLINGYVIIRGEGTSTSHNQDLQNLNNLLDPPFKLEFDATTHLDKGLSIGKNLSIVGIIGKNDDHYFVDEVGGGSPYYSYRVYAYSCQGNSCFYSEGSNIATRSVGRLKVSVQLKEIGTEYLWDYSFTGGRYDMRVMADLYSGKTPLVHYNYWFKNAGDVGKGNTLIWESKADDVKNDSDCDCVQFDTITYTFDIGNNGMRIDFNTHADIRSHSRKTEGHVLWEYKQIVEALLGNQGDGKNAPKNKKNNYFSWGTSGVVYNDNCQGCGDEPHTGYKFYIEYDWLDKDI